MKHVRWTLWLVVAACSGGSTPPTRPVPPTGTGSADAGVPAASAPTERDCTALVDHAVALGAAERAHRPADQQSTQTEQAQLASRLQPFTDECRTLTRDQVRCGLAATTIAELTACQPTLSSSTSNNSVAPGGMTPPAPRSP
jgi:hypothetical protein